MTFEGIWCRNILGRKRGGQPACDLDLGVQGGRLTVQSSTRSVTRRHRDAALEAALEVALDGADAAADGKSHSGREPAGGVELMW